MKKTIRNTALAGLSALAIACSGPVVTEVRDMNGDGVNDIRFEEGNGNINEYIFVSMGDSSYQTLIESSANSFFAIKTGVKYFMDQKGNLHEGQSQKGAKK